MTAPSRLFGLDDPSDVDYDRTQRLRHLPCGWPAMAGCEVCMARVEEEVTEPCPKCDGTGELEDEGAKESCWFCEGTGVNP